MSARLVFRFRSMTLTGSSGTRDWIAAVMAIAFLLVEKLRMGRLCGSWSVGQSVSRLFVCLFVLRGSFLSV